MNLKTQFSPRRKLSYLSIHSKFWMNYRVKKTFCHVKQTLADDANLILLNSWRDKGVCNASLTCQLKRRILFYVKRMGGGVMFWLIYNVAFDLLILQSRQLWGTQINFSYWHTEILLKKMKFDMILNNMRR